MKIPIAHDKSRNFVYSRYHFKKSFSASLSGLFKERNIKSDLFPKSTIIQPPISLVGGSERTSNDTYSKFHMGSVTPELDMESLLAISEYLHFVICGMR